MFLLEGINVNDIYAKYNKGQFPTKLTKNVDKPNPTFIYRKQIQKYVITGKMLKQNEQFVCYLCETKFDHIPYGIPIASRMIEKNIHIDVEGCYCSNECALCMLKFLITQDPSKYRSSSGWLRTIHFLEHPNSNGLKTAPITLLKRFGGFLENHEFVSYIRNRTYRLTNTRLKLEQVGEQYQELKQ